MVAVAAFPLLGYFMSGVALGQTDAVSNYLVPSQSVDYQNCRVVEHYSLSDVSYVSCKKPPVNTLENPAFKFASTSASDGSKPVVNTFMESIGVPAGVNPVRLM